MQLALNWLRIVDNPLQDIPLASVLHSPSPGFSSEELGIIEAAYRKRGEKEKKPRLFHALLAYEKEDELGEKIRIFLNRLEQFRLLSGRLCVHELLQKIFEETGFYDLVSVMPGGKVRRGNLDMLIEKAKK